jgi:hypothetical protein
MDSSRCDSRSTSSPIAFGTGFDVRAARLGALGLAGGAVRERLSAAGEARVWISSAHDGAGAVVLAARALSSGLFRFRGLAFLASLLLFDVTFQLGQCRPARENSNRYPLNSADGSVVRNTKRYTLTRCVATATTLITIRGIPRHGKLKNNSRSLLAQFGLTPKSRRGLATGEV